ncbi:MAG: hypothetical protein Q8R28_08855 [Dehalococcoidia bacterium]|nr:hypothetical protein [Dehalococcoidia bacterium]
MSEMSPNVKHALSVPPGWGTKWDKCPGRHYDSPTSYRIRCGLQSAILTTARRRGLALQVYHGDGGELVVLNPQRKVVSQ